MSEQEQELNTAGLEQETQDDAAETQTENLENTQTETDDEGADAPNNTDEGAYGAPETYDFKDLKLPEGIQIDEKLAQKFAPIGKELNLSQQSANKLANLLVEIQQEQMADAPNKLAEFRKQEREAVRLNYEKLLNNDKEIMGGGEAKMNAFLDVADRGYNTFATPDLKAVLQELHLDYHPAVIKLFHKLGSLTGNDKVLQTKVPVGTKQNAADILYGNSENN